MSSSLFLAVFGVIIASAFAATCSSPTVESTTFTTKDATIVNAIGFITEFSFKCADSNADGLPLFAAYAGRLTPVTRIGDNKYQVSWTEDLKTAFRGERVVSLFDDEGVSAFRKAQRSNGNTDSIAPLATVAIPYSGAFNGPWVNSEILAAGLTIVIAYVAFASKSKLLA